MDEVILDSPGWSGLVDRNTLQILHVAFNSREYAAINREKTTLSLLPWSGDYVSQFVKGPHPLFGGQRSELSAHSQRGS